MIGPIKKLIKKTLEKKGYDIVKKTEPSGKANHSVPFSQTIYVPRWRIKNYFAVREFGESHKRWMTEQKYTYTIGTFPNLDDPRTFNEKIHWLNLNYQDSRITRCCDKYELKNYVTEQLGPGFVVPIIKVYDRASEIDFDELPEKFAIKVNWGDGAEFSEVVSSKSQADESRIKAKMNNAVQPWNNLYYSHFFWGYKNVPPKIFAEEYVEHLGSDLDDYKFHCFNGVPRFVLVCEERSQKRMKKTFLDMEWNVLPCRRADGDVNPNVKQPDKFDEMLRIAKVLAKPFPFVRVDFYLAGDKIYVGEMTFHPGCGLESFIPEEWNTIVGDMLELPERTIIDDE